MFLNEYIKFRTEVGRELLNLEVDKNFKYVANPWSPDRVYTEGMIVYHSVPASILDGTAGSTNHTNTNTSTSGTEGEILAWFRATKTTTKGSFLITEWQPIGGSGGGFVGGLNLFDNIVVNSTIPGTWSTSDNATILPSGADALQFVSGNGIQLEHDVVQNLIRINTDLTVIFDPISGDLNIQGEIVNLGTVGGQWERDDINEVIYPINLSDKVGINTNLPNAYLGMVTAASAGTELALSIANPIDNILKIDDASKVSFGLSSAQRYKEVAMSGTSFTANGDAQNSKVFASLVTNDSSYHEMFLDGTAETIGLYTDTSVVGFKITMAAIQEGGSKEAMLRVYKGAIKKDITTTYLIGSVTEEVYAEDVAASSWEVDITADDTGDYLKIIVRGDGSTIRWIADAELTEINIQ